MANEVITQILVSLVSGVILLWLEHRFLDDDGKSH